MGSVVGDIGGAIFGDRAASRLSSAQRGANALNREIYQEARDYADPFISGGTDAFSQLLASYGVGGQAPNYDQFFASPDYQFALQQGTQALDRSAASRGRLYSGAQLQGAQQFGQGLATQYLGNYRSGLQGAAGLGLNALNTLQNARGQYSAQGVQGLQNLGDISASRQLGYGTAFRNIFNPLDRSQSSYGGQGNALQYGSALFSGGG